MLYPTRHKMSRFLALLLAGAALLGERDAFAGCDDVETYLDKHVNPAAVAKSVGLDLNSPALQSVAQVEVKDAETLLDKMFESSDEVTLRFSNGETRHGILDTSASKTTAWLEKKDGESELIDFEDLVEGRGDNGIWYTLPKKTGPSVARPTAVGEVKPVRFIPYKNSAGSEFKLTVAEPANKVLFSKDGKKNFGSVTKIFADEKGHLIKAELEVKNEFGSVDTVLLNSSDDLGSFGKVVRSDKPVEVKGVKGEPVLLKEKASVSYRQGSDPRTAGKVKDVFVDENGKVVSVTIESQTTLGSRSSTVLMGEEELATLKKEIAAAPVDPEKYKAKVVEGVKPGEMYAVQGVGRSRNKRTIEVRHLHKPIGNEGHVLTEQLTVDLEELAKHYSRDGRNITPQMLEKLSDEEIAILALGQREKWFDENELHDIFRYLSREENFMKSLPCQVPVKS